MIPSINLASDSLGLGGFMGGWANIFGGNQTNAQASNNQLLALQTSETEKTKRTNMLISLGIMACLALVLIALIRR